MCVYLIDTWLSCSATRVLRERSTILIGLRNLTVRISASVVDPAVSGLCALIFLALPSRRAGGSMSVAERRKVWRRWVTSAGLDVLKLAVKGVPVKERA